MSAIGPIGIVEKPRGTDRGVTTRSKPCDVHRRSCSFVLVQPCAVRSGFMALAHLDKIVMATHTESVADANRVRGWLETLTADGMDRKGVYVARILGLDDEYGVGTDRRAALKAKIDAADAEALDYVAAVLNVGEQR